ncbi:GNAT family N-acetyltransferase [Umezawaea tangerina]|uniref:RimJ/RimL family protein N-acetyltransferase n=1 Tax=Umezawaea tangerina TaxID=84725 RepID=A0A2T0SQZ8_9PSEU|nr:GNAT family N-acetyltransferase [Umezawaea tangerina]PRY35829.1 RimJ/RimL family protein N-acetyltransferase [Umezawaea tangerina]
MPHSVHLTPLDADGIERLLAVAVAEATEWDVMPPVDGPPGWSPTRQDAFRRFYRQHHEVMYEVVADDRTVGMIRLTPSGHDGVVETGMWLGRSARGQGIGSGALRAVLRRAVESKWKTVVADTTPENAPAIAALVGCGAVVSQVGDRVVGTFVL